MQNKRNYVVGYKKPPVHSRFPRGKSGNPAGRPKNQKKEPYNVLAILEKLQGEKVSVVMDGKSKIVSRQEAVLMQFLSRAMAGDLKALMGYLRICLMAEDKGLYSPFKGVTKQEIEEVVKLKQMSINELDEIIRQGAREFVKEDTMNELKDQISRLIEQGMSKQDLLKELGISDD